MRRDYIWKYGWIGKGRYGNGANWSASGGNERNRRKYRYYIGNRAPGPLCWQWVDKIQFQFTRSLDSVTPQPEYKCFDFNFRATKGFSFTEHSWVNLLVKGERDGLGLHENLSDRGLTHVHLDPWPTARAKVTD